MVLRFEAADMVVRREQERDERESHGMFSSSVP